MNVLVKILAVIGVLAIILAIVLLLVGVALLSGDTGSVPSVTLLELDFQQGLIEYVPDDPMAKVVLGGRLTVRDAVEAMVRAAEDDRVVGLVARVSASPMGLAQIQDMREAVEAFRESGKPAIAFSETFGEWGPGNGSYYLATAFDEIWLQPSGDLNLHGFAFEHPFLRGVFEKLDIEPRMDQRHEYKNAMNLYTEKEFTEAHREAMDSMVGSHFDQMVVGIAEARGMTEDEVRALVDRGPFLAAEALEAGLVDRLGYRDEMLAAVRENTDEDAQLLYACSYIERAGRAFRRGEDIALIYGVGGILRGKGGFDPISGEITMGSDTVASALRAAVDDEDVRAIVMRVDCPGGSYVASDAVYRETLRAREAGKPLIVSMGNVAASGGYFVSMEADRIVAQPGTITASIGVLGGKLLTDGMWDKIGLSFDDVRRGENATLFSSHHDYSESEWQEFQDLLDRIYDDFTAKVAAGRELSLEEVQRIAKGRVWTGEQAFELGLVDELGGLLTAIRAAREEAGIDPDENIRLKSFPAELTFFQSLTAEEPESSDDTALMATSTASLQAVRPYVRLAEQLGLVRHRGVLTTPVAVPLY